MSEALTLDLTAYERDALVTLLKTEVERGERNDTTDSPWHKAMVKIREDIVAARKPVLPSPTETIDVTVTRSTGLDGAVLVSIDTPFEPTDVPGLRVFVNEGEVFAGVPFEAAEKDREAPTHELIVDLTELKYH